MTQVSKVDWSKMSKAERAEFKLARRSEAVARIKEGKFPGGVRVTLGNHTLTMAPSGVSATGGVSYSYSPSIITLTDAKGQAIRVRVNQMNVTVLGEGQAAQVEDDLDGAELL
jgi:hypothetical protein